MYIKPRVKIIYIYTEAELFEKYKGRITHTNRGNLTLGNSNHDILWDYHRFEYYMGKVMIITDETPSYYKFQSEDSVYMVEYVPKWAAKVLDEGFIFDDI